MTVDALTEEQVRRAIRGDVSHPVLTLLDQKRDRLEAFVRDRPEGSPDEGHRYVEEHFGFVAEAIDGLDAYSMGPTDIIAIGSKAYGAGLASYAAHALYGMTASKFASQGLSHRGWGRIAQDLLTSRNALEVLEDLPRDELIIFTQGLERVRESVETIKHYAGGKPEIPHWDMLTRIVNENNNGVTNVYADVREILGRE